MRKIIEQSIGLIGYDVILGKKGIKDIVEFDKYNWQPFYINDSNVKLYEESMEKTDMGVSNNIYREIRFHSLQQSIKTVLKNNIEGDFAECGCWKGLSAYITCTYLKEDDKDRKFHIFDSFEGGLSERTGDDRDLRSNLTVEEIKAEKQYFSSTEKNLNEALQGFDFYTLYKGWIPERFDEVKDRKFAFVNIDVDVYEPTKDSFQYFFSRLSSGGMIVCDDYNMTRFSGAKKAIDECVKKHEKEITYFYEVPMGACIIIKR